MKIFAFLLVLTAPALALASEVKPGDSFNDVISALGAPKSQERIANKQVLFYDDGKVQLVDGRVTKSDIPAAQTAEIRPGDSLADVEAALGAPKYKEKLGNKLLLSYDRGQVELVDGRVTSVNLLSSEDFAVQQAQQAADAAQAAQLKAQRIAEGEALKAKKLADPAFTSAPPNYQVAFWQDFRRQYPEVSCNDEYKLALARQQEQQAAIQARDQKIADLETRVANAEARAAQAESEAQQARYNNTYPGSLFIGDADRRDQFSEHNRNHDDDNRAPMPGNPAGTNPTPPAARTTSPAGLTMPPSATGLTPPPSASGLTPPPSAWPSH